MNEILKKRIENIPYRITRVGNGANDAYNEGVRHGAEWMLSHMWISVEEALPEANENVLALIGGAPAIARGYHVRAGLKYNTHWMPIPKFETKKK